MTFLINWAAWRNRFHFFLGGGGGGGNFMGSCGGGHRPPYLIFTLIQSNIYKVSVREFLPRDKTDKGISCSLLLYITMSKKYYNIFTRIVRKAL